MDSVRVDDWTAERAIIASNTVHNNAYRDGEDNKILSNYKGIVDNTFQ